jgi:hypothetical protein
VHANGERVAVTAEAVNDAASIQRVSELLRDKYERSSPSSTEAMLREHTLPTTLLLKPAPATPQRA